MYNLERLTVLLVDDNRHMRHLMKTILRSLGVGTIAEADDGSDALKLLRTIPADVVFTDWMMEPLDGPDLTRMVRTGSDIDNPFVPIIMLTGHSEMGRVVEARDAGVTEFLAKPVSADKVYHRLQQIIERPRTFIKTRRYTGPDRRRKAVDYTGKERRKDANDK